MNRLVVVGSIVGCALAAAACGSDSTAPKPDTFSGNWAGALFNSSVSIAANLNMAQNGSALSGTGTASAGGTTENVTISGTSTPPSLNLLVIIAPGTTGDSVTFVGSYISSDSVAGKVYDTEGDSVAVAGFKKQ
jgi:hypothetical protein